MKKLFAIFLILFYNIIFAQDSLNYKLDEVLVTSLHQPTPLFDSNKSIEIIGTKRIETAPIKSIHELLNYSNSVELSQRGANGVQADIGIRGGSFEQTLILLDGIKIVDPQTGHHNLNLPVTLLNIEQIEIVKGNATNINGANAFSGLVNFRTKRNKFNSISFIAEGGNYGLYSGSAFGSYNIGNLSNNFSIEKNHSDGYRKNTEYDIQNFSYGASFTTSETVLDFFTGYTDKSFGANSFYTVKFPLQYEDTKTTFAKASMETGDDALNYSAKIYWRKNDDQFLLDKTDPSFYKNLHTTNIYGGEFDLFVESEIGKTSLGGEYVYDEIVSNSLGNHNRDRFGLFFEHKFPNINKINISVSGFVYRYSTIGVKLWPGVSIGYSASNNINLFANYNRGFRIPTYTELYYNSPTTVGNENLTYEETANYELGVKYFNKYLSATSSIFYKDASNIIDWILPGSDALWQSKNIAELKTIGIEMNLSFQFKKMIPHNFLNSISVNYTYLNSDYKSRVSKSRYLLKHFKHQGIISINHNFIWDIKMDWYFRYEERYNFESNFVTDFSINRTFKNINLFIKASNLFDANYVDFIGVPLPGRWVTAGIKYQIKQEK